VDDTSTRTRTRRRILLILGAALAVATIGVGAASLAIFTSTANVPANTFTAGTVVISTNPASALVTIAAMAPGDQVTAPITVSNTGTLDLRYAITSLATNADAKGLKDQLVLTIKSGVATCTNAAYAATGTIEYTGDLDSTLGMLVGDPTSGADPGDRVLTATTSEVLCFHVSLPILTGNAFQGATTTATFTFDAEQTKNN
jgi:predicted ribosomally synthesized peptide with SipW-like signal peptide